MRHLFYLLILVFGFSLAFAQQGEAPRHIQEKVINASVEKVWEAFTTKEGIESWMVPKGEVDLRVGGAYRSSYNPDSNLNDEHTIVNEILTYDPHRMISIRNVKAPAGFPHSDKFSQTWSVIYFHQVSENQTQVQIVGLGYGEGPEWAELAGYFDQGNSYLLNELEKVLTQ